MAQLNPKNEKPPAKYPKYFAMPGTGASCAQAPENRRWRPFDHWRKQLPVQGILLRITAATDRMTRTIAPLFATIGSSNARIGESSNRCICFVALATTMSTEVVVAEGQISPIKWISNTKSQYWQKQKLGAKHWQFILFNRVLNIFYLSIRLKTIIMAAVQAAITKETNYFL